MRRDRMTIPTFLISVVLAGLISFSCIMCLQEAFSLACRPVMLLVCCTVSAVLASVAMLPRRIWPFVLTGWLLLGVLLVWQRAAVVQSVQYVLYQVTSEYALCFEGVPILGTPEGSGFWLLFLLGVPLAWLTAWIASREGSTALVIMACVPILVICLMIVDVAPVLWLILLTGGLLILLLSHSVRERSPAEGSRLAWWLVLPTIILISGITVLWPPADYVRADWSDALQKVAEAKVDLQVMQETVLSSVPKWNRELREVDLRKVGPKSTVEYHVLDYQSQQKISYLRGVALGHYEDNAWTAVDSAEYHAAGIETQPLIASAGGGVLDVRTGVRQPMLYTTYFLSRIPETAAAVDDSYLQNTGNLTEYSVSFGPAVSNLTSASYDQYVLQQYLQIPDNLREPLEEIAAQAGLVGASADSVAAYVRNLAVYDLQTPRVPDGADFVLYFLQESRQGYCIHFASAATMLLRTVGIPARYVTGYSVSGEAGQWNEVTEKDAHAWVEYYVAGFGWHPLEATPADANDPDEPETEQEPEKPQPETPEREEPEQSTNQPAPTTPVGTGQSAAGSLPAVFRWSLVVPGMVLLILLRRWMGLRYRKNRCKKGHPNRRALAWWRWLVQLSKAGGMQISEELLCLAEKARFSQHTMEEKELLLLQQAAEARISELRTEPLARRLWHQYGLVLY